MKSFSRTVFLVFALLLLTIALVSCGEPTSTTAPEGEGTTTTVTTVTEKPLPSVGNPSAIGYPSNKKDNLPNLYINTEEGAPIVSRDEYIKAAVSVSGTLDDTVFGFENKETEVRCRGNFTYNNTDKKSYRLKFTEKVNLFGQGYGPAKSWVLLANHCDKSFLRNHLAFTAARLLDNIEYCTSSSFVKLYVNGEYYGIYQVAEQHNTGDYRVNIHEDQNKIDTDYLIERDSYADEDGYEGLTYFRINRRTKYNIKTDYPDAKLMEEKCTFLRNYFEKTHEAIKNGDKNEVLKYIDIDSFIDTMILQALVKNTDVGYSSFFMVKKAGGKLYFTCPWDFDLSLGNDARLDMGRVPTLYVGQKTDMMQQHEWFYFLMNQEWFCDMLLKRWDEVRTTLFDAMIFEIDRFLVAFNDDMSTNFDIWNIFKKKINQEPPAVLKLTSYKAQVNYLRDWYIERYNYVDSLFHSEDLYKQGGWGEPSGGSGWWGW